MSSARYSEAPSAKVNGATLYLRLSAASVRAQMQYPASFVMMLIGNLAGSGIEFLGIWVLFDRFGTLHGWKLEQIALFYGVINVAFAIAEATGRGFDTFNTQVIAGDFDRVLLRPRGTALQVGSGTLQMMRAGRLIQGGTALIWACSKLKISFALWKLILVGEAILGGSSIFLGLMVLQATMCFWTVQTLEIMNTVTYGGTETAQYPLTIYRPWFRRFFTFVVPLACANYIPLNAVTAASNTLTPAAFLAPFAGPVFLFVSFKMWNIGVRKYHSTGS